MLITAKRATELSLEELLKELKELESIVEKPFVQLVMKIHVRGKGDKRYYYRYWYLQHREGNTVKSLYLGKNVPEWAIERIRLQNRYRALKRELERRVKHA